MSKFPFLSLIFGLLLQIPLSAQTEVQAWGNITGVRVNGLLLRFESSLRLVEDAWNREQATGRERNWTTYHRESGAQIVRTRMDSLFFTETVRDGAPGKLQVEITLDPREDLDLIGVFFHIALPAKYFASANISLLEPATINLSQHNVLPVGEGEILRALARGLAVKSPERDLTIKAPGSRSKGAADRRSTDRRPARPRWHRHRQGP